MARWWTSWRRAIWAGGGAFDERGDAAAVGDEGEGFEGFGGVFLQEAVDAAA